MLAQSENRECGCPEEHWLVGGIDLTMHFEPEGRVDAFMDGGDWGEADITLFTANSLEIGRSAAISWALDRLGA